MKEKISMVQLTKNQQKEVTGGQRPSCTWPDFWEQCICLTQYYYRCSNFDRGYEICPAL